MADLGKVDRFDLEQQIMDCWGIVDDIQTVYSASDSRPVSEDEMMNALLGLQTIYQMKFEKLQETFAILVQQGVISGEQVDKCLKFEVN
jgi:hypothetical protein